MAVKDLQNTIFFNDPPEQIAMCLSCEKPYCTDCLSYYGQNRNPRPYRRRGAEYKDVKNKLVEYFKQGKKNVEITALLCVSKDTVSHWKARLKKEGLL